MKIHRSVTRDLSICHSALDAESRPTPPSGGCLLRYLWENRVQPNTKTKLMPYPRGKDLMVVLARSTSTYEDKYDYGKIALDLTLQGL